MANNLDEKTNQPTITYAEEKDSLWFSKFVLDALTGTWVRRPKITEALGS